MMSEKNEIVSEWLLQTYGPRLSIEQIAHVVGMSPGTIYNRAKKGTFSVPTYVDGKKRWADFRDVAQYFDDCRERSGTNPGGILEQGS